MMRLCGVDPDSEDHEGPAAAAALGQMLLDIRKIAWRLDCFFEAKR
jgi:hypothetical protein